ncbi:MAG: hypothetical protein KJ621_20795 [Proteobacteria bacterium]|nr:hypothetical protein [Pseudomonadota bacterium]
MKRAIGVLIGVAFLVLTLSGSAMAITAKDMAKFLPVELAGFKAPMQVLTNDMKMKTYTISAASRVYIKGQTKVRIALTAGPMVKTLAKMAGMKLSVDTPTSRIKSYKVAGFNARESYNKKMKLLTVQVFVSNLVMVQAQIESGDPKPALTLLKAVDLKGLSNLK